MPWVVQAQSCSEQGIQAQVLGSGGPQIDDGRSSSSHLIWVDGKATVLVDAGAGSYNNFSQAKADFNDLKAILLTHLHVDHSADLPAFIKGSYFTGRQDDLPVYGPQGNDMMPDIQQYMQQLFGEKGAYQYLSNYLIDDQQSSYKVKPNSVSLSPKQAQYVQLGDDILAHSIGVHHGPISAVAWRVQIGDCRITFSGDMSNDYDSLKSLAHKSDVLVANNAIPENAPKQAQNLHMTPTEIGQIAQQAKVKKLVLAHFMKASDAVKEDSVKLIKKQYQGPVELAEDMMVISFKK
ncbi:MAG: MBL fold metallo-hydrolase [Proteobacteria bacterium]|nr:MBL fold metallo-hydrolase [Pseudomonadota bacterium]